MINDDILYIVPTDYNVKNDKIAYGKTETVEYCSSTLDKLREVTVILPPNYSKNKEYPVLYLCHGLGQDNMQWTEEGKADIIIGNLIAEGEAEEMIMVLPNCRARENDSANPPDAFSISNYEAFDNFYNEFINDLKPFIEAKYSIKRGRNNNAVAGFSMGGRVALHLGIGMQKIFGYVAAFCPAPGIFAYTLNGVTEKGLFNLEDFKLKDEYASNTLLMIVGGKSDNIVFDYPESYHKQLKANRTKHIWYKLSGGHDFNVAGKGLHNFAKELFK